MADDVVIHHPNREGAAPNATRAAVVLLLLVSAALIAIITIGGWSSLEGAQIVSVVYIIIFCVMAYMVARWSRGVLPLASALAIIMLVFAAIAAPGWFDRSHIGFDNPGLPPDLIGTLTVILIPVLLILIAFSMRGFTQAWNVEVEMTREQMERRGRRGNGGGPGAHRAQEA